MAQTSTILVGTAIVIGAGLLVYKFADLSKKGLQASRLTVGIDGVSPKKGLSVMEYALGIRAIPATTGVKIGNYTTNKYEISQIFVQVLDSNGVLIAEQLNPLSSSVSVLPNVNTIIPIEISVIPAGVKALLKGVSFKDGILPFLTGGKLGKEVIVKGYVVAEGIKTPIDTKVMI